MSFATQPFYVMFFTVLAQPFDTEKTLQLKVPSTPHLTPVVDTTLYHELSTPRLTGPFFLPQQPNNKWLQHQVTQPYRWGNMLQRHIFVNQASPEKILQGQSWNSLRAKSHIAFRHNLFTNQSTTSKR